MIPAIFFPLEDNVTMFLLPSDLSLVSFTSPLAPISFTMLLTDGCECPISLAIAVMVFAPPRDSTKKTENPFRADVHAVHAVNQFGVICYLVRQHAQSASNGHFARLVEKIHMRFFVLLKT